MALSTRQQILGRCLHRSKHLPGNIGYFKKKDTMRIIDNQKKRQKEPILGWSKRNTNKTNQRMLNQRRYSSMMTMAENL